MLVVDDDTAPYLAKQLEFADSIGLRQQLDSKLEYLRTYAAHRGEDNVRCELYPDFAPHSFRFVMKIRKEEKFEYWFNGGLIYQGPDSPANGSFPSLTVSLAEGIGWFVHT